VLSVRGLHDTVLRRLATLAMTPVVEGLVVSAGASLDLGEPLWDGAPFTAVLVGAPGGLVADLVLPPLDGAERGPVRFFPVLPMTPNEAAWKRVHGAGALEQRWLEHGGRRARPGPVRRTTGRLTHRPLAPSCARRRTLGRRRARGRSGMQFGRYFEEFEVGAVYKHWPGKTVTEYDDHLFCLLTMNHHPLHLDANYASSDAVRRNVVVGNYVYSLLLGMSVPDVSGRRSPTSRSSRSSTSRRRSTATPSTARRQSSTRPSRGPRRTAASSRSRPRATTRTARWSASSAAR
jgi:hypothetical protein